MGAVVNLRPDLFARRRRRGAVRRRRHHDARRDAPAHGHRVGGVGRTRRRRPRSTSVHEVVLALRQRARRSDYPAMLVTGGLNDPRVAVLGAGQVGREAADHEDPTTDRCCSDRDGRRATAARRAGTTPGVTRPWSSPSSSTSSASPSRASARSRRAGGSARGARRRGSRSDRPPPGNPRRRRWCGSRRARSRRLWRPRAAATNGSGS